MCAYWAEFRFKDRSRLQKGWLDIREIDCQDLNLNPVQAVRATEQRHRVEEVAGVITVCKSITMTLKKKTRSKDRTISPYTMFDW